MRIIIKVGSNVLTKPDGRLSFSRIAALVDEITDLTAQDNEVVLVTSGAVAAGRTQVQLSKTADRVAQRQVLSSVGQAILIDSYRTIFLASGKTIGQILVTKSDFSTASHVTTMRQCFTALLENNIIPIVNENDTVSVESLMFTDNDELAGLIAKLLKADLLILLTSTNGLYTGDPNDPKSTLIRQVTLGEDCTAMVKDQLSTAGRGGMKTKLAVTTRMLDAKIPCIIANGTRHHILHDVLTDPNTPCTRFILPDTML